MRELKCPKCGSVFSVDEADYASILSQVKGAEFDAEVARRIDELNRQHKDAMRIALLQEQQRAVETLRAKETEIAQLKADAQLAKSAAELRERGLRTEFAAQRQVAKSEAAVREHSIKESYEGKLNAAEELVAYYKDLTT
ncbi:MAG: hypothetical protein J6W74_02140, partial [Bacteroidales bacterium]|nr:hypothetical protein [Bacteroidales bacterium]